MMTPNEITNKIFTKARMGGYKTTEVDDFLVETASTVSQLNRDIGDLKRKLDAANKKSSELEDEQVSLSQALLNAQRLADSIVRDAQTKADLTLRDAQIKAEKIKEKVKDAILQEQDEFNRMKTEIVAFRKNILDLYKSQIELIMKIPGDEILDKSGQTPEPEEEPKEEPQEPEAEQQEKVPENKPEVEETQQEQPLPQKEAAASAASEKAEVETQQRLEPPAEEKPEPVLQYPKPGTIVKKPEDRPGRNPEIKLSLRFDEDKGVYIPANEKAEEEPDVDTKFGTKPVDDDDDFAFSRYRKKK